MSLTIAVCDDDVVVCRHIKKLLQDRNSDYAIDVYGSGEELIKSAKEYDIIFLDIEMRQINGLKTAKILRNMKREDYIIFLTSHTECMPDAFKVRAFRFLNKPIQIKKFTEAITEAEKEILRNEKVIIPSQGRMILVSQKDIVYIESLGDGTCLYTTKEELVTGKSLKYWEQTLDSTQFFKIHKSYFLGLRYVKGINPSDISINFQDIKLPIARRKKTEFQEYYMQYIRNYARNI